VVGVAPAKVLKVEYKKSHREVTLGNELAPKEVRDQPEVSYRGT
jgi:hypothetical protein